MRAPVLPYCFGLSNEKKPEMTKTFAPNNTELIRRDIQACTILLDTRSPWLVEFARALCGIIHTRAFSPDIALWGRFRRGSGRISSFGPLSVSNFPLQRGYFSEGLGRLVSEDRRIFARLAIDDQTGAQPFICCLPHYARVAEKWRGPVVYYVTDLFRAYSGWSPEHISGLEHSMCQTATLVCPNSQRIADVLVRDSGCDPNRILILPNAVRQENLLSSPSSSPMPLPPDAGDLPRPVAGVIGNLAQNTDWELTEQAVNSTPWLSWLFVGPYSGPISDASQASARARLIAVGGRVRFTGPKPYGDLKDYARALDVAILPYRKREPTYSGSSTRFYEHLAACRPMIASRGFEELLHKAPLLRLADSPEELVKALEELRSLGFNDGLTELRWETSMQNIWEERARQMIDAVQSAMGYAATPFVGRPCHG